MSRRSILLTKDLSEKLVTLREEKHLTQSELADKMHIEKQSVTRWENGHVKTIKLQYLIELAEQFGVPVEYLKGETDEKDPIVYYEKNEKDKDEKERALYVRIKSLFEMCGFDYRDVTKTPGPEEFNPALTDEEHPHKLHCDSGIVPDMHLSKAELDEIIHSLGEYAVFEYYKIYKRKTTGAANGGND